MSVHPNHSVKKSLWLIGRMEGMESNELFSCSKPFAKWKRMWVKRGWMSHLELLVVYFTSWILICNFGLKWSWGWIDFSFCFLVFSPSQPRKSSFPPFACPFRTLSLALSLAHSLSFLFQLVPTEVTTATVKHRELSRDDRGRSFGSFEYRYSTNLKFYQNPWIDQMFDL